MATHLDTINKVLVRLREATVTTSSGSEYVSLISRLIHDARREVEDAWDWQALKSLVPVNVSSGESSVAITGSNRRTRIISVFNDTAHTALIKCSREWIIWHRQVGTQTAGAPQYWAMGGCDSSGLLKIELHPTSSASYTLSVDCVIPQIDISDSTEMSVSDDLVYLRATALALAERGEDGGHTFSELMGAYAAALNDAVSHEKSTRETTALNEDWYVP
jgi:hypothetical protein